MNESQVVNEYGAFHGDIIDDIDGYVDDLESAIIRICSGEHLDPVDVRLLGSYIELRVSGRISEIILHRAQGQAS